MTALLAAFALLAFGALGSALAARRPRAARAISTAGLVLGCAAGLAAALWGFSADTPPVWRAPWPVPLGELALSIDPLSAFFLLVVFATGLPSGLFGESYLATGGRAPARVRPLYCVFLASMAAVVCAANGVLFLAAWESMALSGFFLVIAEDCDPSVRRAGLLYLVCTHAATLCLLVMFALLAAGSGSLDLAAGVLHPSGARRAAVLALALVGFGLKAGFMPLHVWLQEAHPAAPAHVSAVLSGAMLKTGIYGLCRVLALCAPVPAWVGAALLAVGASSGVLGVLFALAQHDLKRLLAYHSIENIGIIALGLGVGCLGAAEGRPGLAVLGFGGGILHCLNHGLFKSLLFLGSGTYARALGTRDIEGAGGLLRRMPWTSLFSLVGAASICGLPPFNGFISEWLVFWGLLDPAASGGARYAAFAAAALALIGGLAAACFTKAYGALCLGEPRTDAARSARDPGAGMLAPMGALAALCLLIGVVPGPAVAAAGRAAAVAAGLDAAAAAPMLALACASAAHVGAISAALLVLCALAASARSALLSGRSVAAGPTWGCGYGEPTPRMQYTASSYAEPLVRQFAGALRTHEALRAPAGYWPKESSFSSHTDDAVLEGALMPAAGRLAGMLGVFRRLQHGRAQLYLLYVAVTVVALLLWTL